ncbi:MAG: hypothetical protein LBI72_11485 [Flavobacteriaceae bacterium]|nr:hypothetical protein [Flavobacteriaceae bacterium]
MKKRIKFLVGVLVMGAIASCSSKDDSPSGGGSGQTQTIEVLEKEVEKLYLREGNAKSDESIEDYNKQTSYTYDEKGLMIGGRSLIIMRGEENQDINFKVEYDVKNRFTRMTSKDKYGLSAEVDSKFTYDDKGRLLNKTTVTDPQEQMTFFYNNKDQVIKIERLNERGNLRIYEGYQYNSKGLLSGMLDDVYAVEGYEYDDKPTPYVGMPFPFSFPLDAISPYVGEIEWTYKASNNLVKLSRFSSDGSVREIVEIKYEYDKVTGKPLKSVMTLDLGTNSRRIEKEFVYKTITIKK